MLKIKAIMELILVAVNPSSKNLLLLVELRSQSESLAKFISFGIQKEPAKSEMVSVLKRKGKGGVNIQTLFFPA